MGTFNKFLESSVAINLKASDDPTMGEGDLEAMFKSQRASRANSMA